MTWGKGVGVCVSCRRHTTEGEDGSADRSADETAGGSFKSEWDNRRRRSSEGEDGSAAKPIKLPVAGASPSGITAEGAPLRVWGIGGNRGAPSACICLGSQNVPPARFGEPHPSKFVRLT